MTPIPSRPRKVEDQQDPWLDESLRHLYEVLGGTPFPRTPRTSSSEIRERTPRTCTAAAKAAAAHGYGLRHVGASSVGGGACRKSWDPSCDDPK